MNKLSAIDIYIARLLMLGFFLPGPWQATAVSSAFGYFSLRVFFMRRFISARDFFTAIAIGSIFLLYALALLLTPANDQPQLALLLGNRMTLLLFPFMAAVVMPYFSAVIRGALGTFVYACLAACVMANAAFAVHFYSSGQILGPLGHVAYRQYMEHFLGLHPTYLSMYIVFAICLLLTEHVEISRWVKIALLYLLLIFLLALLAKSPIIALLMILACHGYIYRDKLKQYRALLGSMALAVSLAFMLIPFARQRVGELFSFAGKGQHITVANNSMYERRMIWATDKSLLRDYWLTGAGPGRAQRLLNYRYLYNAIYHSVPSGYFDPHNAYVWEWLCFGIAGIVVLSVISGVHFIVAIKRKDHLYLYLMCLLCVTFATESVLSRQQGILFFAAFTSLLFFYRPQSLLRP